MSLSPAFRSQVYWRGDRCFYFALGFTTPASPPPVLKCPVTDSMGFLAIKTGHLGNCHWSKFSDMKSETIFGRKSEQAQGDKTVTAKVAMIRESAVEQRGNAQRHDMRRIGLNRSVSNWVIR